MHCDWVWVEIIKGHGTVFVVLYVASANHVMICHHSGLTFVHHYVMWDLTASWLSWSLPWYSHWVSLTATHWWVLVLMSSNSKDVWFFYTFGAWPATIFYYHLADSFAVWVDRTPSNSHMLSWMHCTIPFSLVYSAILAIQGVEHWPLTFIECSSIS